MTKTSHPFLLAAALLAVTASGLRAQCNCPATPRDNAASEGTEGRDDKNLNVPGWTGRTFVAGSTSTIAGAATATRIQQTGQYGRGR